MGKDLEDLAAEIRALPLPDRLRLAAGLLESQRAEMAYAILDTARVELGAALALAKRRPA